MSRTLLSTSALLLIALVAWPARAPFAGSLSTSSGGTTVSVDSTQFHLGANAGLLAWF